MNTLPCRIRRAPLYLALAVMMAAPGLLLAADPGAPQASTIAAEAAAKPLQQSWTIADDATIEIHNVRGSVDISAGEPGHATLDGSLGAGSRLVIAGDSRRLELHVEAADQQHGWFNHHGPASDTTLNLKVPAGVSVRLELVSADAKVSGINGKSLNVECVSGKLTLDSGAEQVDVESVSGDVIFKATRADPSHRIHLQTVSGDIELSGASGRVKFDSVSGNVRLTGEQLQEFEAGTVSGSVNLVAATLAKHGRVQVETMSGDIRTALPADVSARIEAESFSGRIRSDFGTVKKPEYGPGSSLEATMGDGDAQVSTKSFSGNVDILKKQ